MYNVNILRNVTVSSPVQLMYANKNALRKKKSLPSPKSLRVFCFEFIFFVTINSKDQGS
jgi:hypothetical protein